MKSIFLVIFSLLIVASAFSFDVLADDLKLSDIISGDGSVSATGDGKTTTYSGSPQTGLNEETQSEGNTAITWKEYVDGLNVLNQDVESGKLTESQWNEKTQALRQRFLEGERQRVPRQADLDAPSVDSDGVSGLGVLENGAFGDDIGASNFASTRTPGRSLDPGFGTEVFTAPGGPGSFPSTPSDDPFLNDATFQNQRFDELYGGKFSDPNEQPN